MVSSRAEGASAAASERIREQFVCPWCLLVRGPRQEIRFQVSSVDGAPSLLLDTRESSRRRGGGVAPRRYGVLADLGFTAALSLQESYEDGPEHQEMPPGFTQAQVPIRDGIVGGIPSVDQIAEAVEKLHGLLDNHVVYVHCFAGVGRSPLVCAAYLARYHLSLIHI